MKHILEVYRREYLIFLTFFLAAVFIIGLHFLFHPLRVLGMETSIFYMDEKYTLASFFTSVSAFLTGYLVLVNLRLGKGKLFFKMEEIAYGAFFILLAMDEYFEIHEYFNTFLKQAIKADNFFYDLVHFSWIFSLILVITLILVLLIRKGFRANLVAKKALASGIACFCLVLIFELIGSKSYGKNIYLYLVAIEEGLEMMGISFFLLTALIEAKIKRA